MKFGVRTPSLKRRVSARTSVKRIARHNLGLKMPKGGGFVTNPKKAAYNRIYNRTSVSADRILSKASSGASSGNDEAGGCLGIFLALAFGGAAFAIGGFSIGGFIAAIVLAVVGMSIGIAISVKADSDAEGKAQIAALSEAINGHLEKARSGKTLPTRDKNCLQAIELLEALEQVHTDPNEKTKTKALLAGVKASHKILPVADLVTKAERAEFKNQKKRALNCYLDALLECRNSNITNRDMALAQFKDDQTSEQITLSWLDSKARGLGWEEEPEQAQPPPAPGPQAVDCPGCGSTVTIPEFRLNQDGEGACPHCGQEVVLKED